MTNPIILHDLKEGGSFDPNLCHFALHANPARFIQDISTRVDSCRADSGVSRLDAAETLFSARDLEQILAEVLRDRFGPLYSDRYIPIGSFGIAPWNDRYIQKRITPQGLLDYVNSANMPWINVSMTEITHKIYTLGAKFGYSWFELQQANQAGVPLRNELAIATRNAAARTQDMILLRGDAGLPKGSGFIPTGLINDPSVSIAALVNGDWGGAATVDEILADFAAMYSAYRVQTRREFRADTLLVDEPSFARLQFLRVGDSGKNLLQYLVDSVTDLAAIDVLPELETAGAGGVPRKILYANNPEVLQGVVPLPFTFIADEAARLRIDVWGVMRLVGVDIKMPFAVTYFDG